MHQTLISKVDFTKSNDWQHVVSRQDYGTFYCIYMQVLEATESKISVKSKAKVQFSYEFKFYIQNFEGAVTIGISDVDVREATNSEKSDKNDNFDYCFTLSCKPFYSNPFSKILKFQPNEKLKSGSIVDFSVEMDFPPHDMYNPNNLEQSEYVSPERHVRDGEQVFDIVIEERDGIGKHGTNKRCYQRRSKIM